MNLKVNHEIESILQCLVAEFMVNQGRGINRFIVGYSGGLDSQVLLHVLSQYRCQSGSDFILQAVHINHGLSSFAQNWAQHCQETCVKLAVPLTTHALTLHLKPGDSLEAIARQARYEIFAQYMTSDTALLTAHHQDDQAETFLLQLLRGAGLKGLTAMPIKRSFKTGYLCRPLLNVTRQQLHEYAKCQKLQWVEDESNLNDKIARNYLRQYVMPMLRQRWPAMTKTIARSIKHCAEAQALLDEFAAEDLATLLEEPYCLNESLLRQLSLPRQSHVLRYWIRQQGAIMPNERRLSTFLYDLINSGVDKTPQLQWHHYRMFRKRQRIYFEVALYSC